MIIKQRLTIQVLAAFAILLFAPVLVTIVHAPAGPTYSLTTSPTKLNEIEYPIITFSITGGTASTSYTFQVTVTKPGSAGQAQNSLFLTTDSSGSGTGALVYSPNYTPAWIVCGTCGSVNTDVAGNYTITIVETSPKSVTTGFPTTTFQVVNTLTVAIISPTAGSTIQRGNPANFIATVFDVNGLPVANAQVSVSSPSGGQVALSPTTPSGTYSGSYRVQRSDPLGPWNVTAAAYWPSTTENFGSWSISVNVSPSQLIISSLSTYNEYGSPTADFSPSDTVYASFSVSFPAGGYLTNGSFIVNVKNPSGSTVTTLTCIFDPNRNLFYTPSGFQVSASDPAGDWELVFPAQSVRDQYGNTGPTASITFRFVVHQASNQATISPFYFAIAALAIVGGLSAAVFFKRFNSTTGPFEDLFKLTGGEMQPATTLMIASDSGAGSTTMGLQLLYRELAKGKFCGLLSYDAFPSEISRRMRDMGWDITEFVKTGQLKIMDCYSALAGAEGSLIKDPTDFTEVSIQVTHLIESANGPVTLLLDSVTPIFNSSPAKDCINFLAVIGAKIKNSKGIFMFTATKGSIPEEARSKIEAMADGVIEMNLIKRANSLTRTLQVKKMAGHQASSVETGFEIIQGKGIAIRKRRMPIGLFGS